MSRPKSRFRPADYAETSARMTCRELRTHYRASSEQVAQWNEEVGRERRPNASRQPAPMPADFPEHAGLKLEELTEMYGRAVGVLRRWRIEAGYVPVKKEPVQSAPKPRPAPIQLPVSRTITGVGAATPFHRDMSEAGQAADYLRQFGAVWRCTPTGRPDPKGKFWRRGHAVLSDAEIIERAEWMRNRRMAA